MNANPTIQIVEVVSKEEWKTFIRLPEMIYQDFPHYIFPLEIAQRDQLDTTKNPFFEHAEKAAFLAYEGEKPVGRILFVIDRAHCKLHGENAAFWGYFESLNRKEVAHALLERGEQWARARRMTVFRGPIQLSTNNECGLLVEGFADTPTPMMSYNPPYYNDLIESAGFSKAKDLYAWEVRKESRFSDRLVSHAKQTIKNEGIRFRSINMKKYDQEVDQILEIYNDAWEKNWGFVPMTENEFRHTAADMKHILNPNLLFIAEVKGEPAAFSLALPDFNRALKGNKSGRPSLWGWFKLLWFLKGPGKYSLGRCRIVTLGIKQKFRNLGLGPLMYASYHKIGPKLGYPIGECSWILEDNTAMNRALADMGAQKTKVYRVFEKLLSEKSLSA
ncbi:N-acetyltransferase [Bdellovibrionota bacterium FG-2]